MKYSQELNKIATAYGEFQEKLIKAPIKATQDGHRWKFADIDDVKRVVTPLLKECGLALIPGTENLEVQGILYRSITMMLIHQESGQWMKAEYAMPNFDDAQNTMFAYGGALTYFRRYLMNTMLNISVEDEVERAQTVKKSTAGTISEKQLGLLTYKMREQPEKKQAIIQFCQERGLTAFTQISLSDFNQVLELFD